jgi:hypothetical protein
MCRPFSVSSGQGHQRREANIFRALSILTAIAALAVSAAPIASAGSSTKPPPRSGHMEEIPFYYATYLKAAPPKPPRMGTRSGGEIITGNFVITDGTSNTMAKLPRARASGNGILLGSLGVAG